MGALATTSPGGQLQTLQRRADQTGGEAVPRTDGVDDTHREDGRYRINVNKVIYGSVNGGGPDIEMRTFNGNIYLRKGDGTSPAPSPNPNAKPRKR